MSTIDIQRTDSVATRTLAAPVLDVVVPVHNEQAAVEPSVRRLHAYLSESFPLAWQITIADSGSSDATWPTACRLAHELPGIRVVRVVQKGRGLALRTAWESSEAAVLAYMDVDLSTDLAALLPLVAPLVSGHSDLAIGTRLAASARVVRGPKRELISRCYNAILRTTLRARFTDAQCGFKAIRRDRAAALLPQIEDQGWFFDTELLVLAERSGLRIHEVPVDWVDDPHSTVDIAATAIADLRGVARLMRAPRLARQLSQFVAIGIASTLAYVAGYVALRGSLGAVAANTLALAVTAVANTAANRRITFRVTQRAGMLRHQLQGLVVFGLALALTTGSLALLSGVDARASRATEVTVLLLANLAATVVRFGLLRLWVFRANLPPI
jgi:putative flippase GtrA